MARVSKRAPTDEEAIAAAVAALARLGLVPEQRVRFRRSDGGRWMEGVAAGREPDGSLGLHDRRAAGDGRSPSRRSRSTGVALGAGRSGCPWSRSPPRPSNSTSSDERVPRAPNP